MSVLQINNVEFAGRLGADARIFGKDADNVSINVASTKPDGKDAEGKSVYKTTWITVNAYNVPKKKIEQLKKGTNIYVGGDIATDEYTPEGETKTRRVTYIRAKKLTVINNFTDNDNTSEEEVVYAETEQ